MPTLSLPASAMVGEAGFEQTSATAYRFAEIRKLD